MNRRPPPLHRNALDAIPGFLAVAFVALLTAAELLRGCSP